MITPIDLTLVNTFQYKKVTMTFHPGITGYLGPNGTGKTNLIDNGLYFAITGDTGPFKKDEMIRFGSASGHTQFRFEHSGVQYTLLRNLHNAGVKLEWLEQPSGEKKEEKGSDNVNRLIEQMVGMPFDIMREVCWGSQEELVAVIKMTHAKRLAFFQRLANVTKTEIWRSTIQERISKLPVIEDKSVEHLDLLTRLKDLDKRIEADQCALNNLAAENRSPEQYEKRNQEIAVLLSLPAEAAYLLTMNQKKCRLEQLETSLLGASASLEKLQSATAPVVDPHMEEWNRRYIRLVELTAEYDRISPVAFPAIDPCPVPVRTAVDALRNQVGELKAGYQLAKSKVCPTCQRPFDVQNPEEVIRKYEKLSLELQAASSAYDKELSEYNAREKLITKIKADSEAHARRLAEVTAELSALLNKEPKIPTEFTPDLYAAQVERVRQYNSQAAERQRLTAETARLGCLLESAQKDLREYLNTRYLSATEREQLTGEAAGISAATQAFRQTELALQGLLSTKTTLLEQKQKIEKSEERRKKVEDVIQALSKVRDQLHKERLPKIVMSKMLNGLNAYLSYYLDRFEAPFTARITDDFDFETVFPDGKVMPGRSLSGGLKVTLVFALKFAQSELFGKELPMMVLDEPTTWLDRTNIGRMSELFRLARGFTEKGSFVIVATHEPEILSSMSRTIELELEKQ